MKNNMLAIIGFSCLLIGISLVGYSLTQNRYSDAVTYNEKYLSIDSSATDASDQFAALRDEYLTPKFTLENYGISMLILGLLVLIVGRTGFNRLRTPSRRIGLIVLGCCASVLACMAVVGDVFIGMYRESYPHWADSLAIPLISAAILLFVLLVWTGIVLIWAMSPFALRVNLFPISIRQSNGFLLIVLFITLLITLYVLVTGYFWMILPAALWIYFYLSIIQGKRQATMITDTNVVC